MDTSSDIGRQSPFHALSSPVIIHCMSCPANWLRILLTVAAMSFPAHGHAADEPTPKGNKAQPVFALEQVTWRDEAMQRHDIAGRILVEATDGGLLVIGQDGKLWSIDRGELISRNESGEPFRPVSPLPVCRDVQ